MKRLGGLALVRGLPFSIGQSPWEESRDAWAIHVEFLLSPGTTIDFERRRRALAAATIGEELPRVAEGDG